MKRAVLISLVFLVSAVAHGAEPVRIESERLEVVHQQNRADFTGDVLLTRSDFELRCDRLVAYYKDRTGGELDRAEAFGHVTMVQGEKRGRGDTAIYRQKEGVLTLVGNAEMVEPGRTVRGEKIVHHLESTRTEVQQGEKGGRVHLSIEAEDDAPEKKEEAAP